MMNQVRLFQHKDVWTMEIPHPADNPALCQEIALVANQPDVVAVYVEQGKLTLCIKTADEWRTITADVSNVRAEESKAQVAMLGGPYPRA